MLYFNQAHDEEKTFLLIFSLMTNRNTHSIYPYHYLNLKSYIFVVPYPLRSRTVVVPLPTARWYTELGALLIGRSLGGGDPAAASA